MGPTASSDEDHTSTRAGAADLLDRARALANIEGDAGLLAEMARLFLEDCPRQLAEIRQAIARGDAQAVAECAHAIKGSVGNFAAQQAFDRASKLEVMARQGNLAHAGEGLAELETALQQIGPPLGRWASGEA